MSVIAQRTERSSPWRFCLSETSSGQHVAPTDKEDRAETCPLDRSFSRRPSVALNWHRRSGRYAGLKASKATYELSEHSGITQRLETVPDGRGRDFSFKIGHAFQQFSSDGKKRQTESYFVTFTYLNVDSLGRLSNALPYFNSILPLPALIDLK